MPRTTSRLLYHIVFATKRRLPLIPVEMEADLHAYVGGILRHHDAWLLAMGGMPDHVHLLLGLRPVHCLAEIVKHVKGSSSRWLSKQRPSQPFAWQEGYGAFTVSPSQTTSVRRYILSQPHHHRDQSFDQEWQFLLQRSNLSTRDTNAES